MASDLDDPTPPQPRGLWARIAERFQRRRNERAVAEAMTMAAITRPPPKKDRYESSDAGSGGDLTGSRAGFSADDGYACYDGGDGGYGGDGDGGGDGGGD